MTPEPNRRQLFALGASAVAVASAASAIAEPFQDGPAAGNTKGDMKPIAMPDKLKNTAPAGISLKTHEEHYKLYTGYVKKVNEIRGKLAAMGVPDPTKANQTFSEIRELKVEYTFALGGVKNHELYFNILGGQGGAPNGDIADVIKASFGSYENWVADLAATGAAARGWVWLAHDYTDGSVFNYIGDAQNAFPIWHATPLLALDVYEHAYYLDFQTGRGKYIAAFLKSIDWDEVNKNLAVAKAVAAAAKK